MILGRMAALGDHTLGHARRAGQGATCRPPSPRLLWCILRVRSGPDTSVRRQRHLRSPCSISTFGLFAARPGSHLARASRFRFRLRICRFSSRYTRQTRLWLSVQPSCCSRSSSLGRQLATAASQTIVVEASRLVLKHRSPQSDQPTGRLSEKPAATIVPPVGRSISTCERTSGIRRFNRAYTSFPGAAGMSSSTRTPRHLLSSTKTGLRDAAHAGNLCQYTHP